MRDERAGFNPVHLYEYLAKARAKLLDWVRPLTLAQYTKEFPFGLKTLRDTLVEIPLSEWTYVQRLRGKDVPPWDERPLARFYKTDFPPLERAWQEQAEETRRTLREISDWTRPLEYVARPSDEPPVKIRTTTGGAAAQLFFHEIHHRAQAMAMLRQLGVPAENLDYSLLMYERMELPPQAR